MAIEKTYLHTGIPVAAKMPKMAYMKALKVWIANNTEYGIEYLYWEKDTPAAFRMVTETHVAYKVKDVAAAVKASKYADWGVAADGKPQDWGEIPEGRILLQDHSDSTVSFCNLKVREL